MYPPIFVICSADAQVQANIGSNPCRLYPFGEAPQGITNPYAVWQITGGSPENYLKQVPDTDLFSLQIDVYATTESDARSAAEALRDAIEPQAYVTFWNGELRDSDTNLYRVIFSVDWWVSR